MPVIPPGASTTDLSFMSRLLAAGKAGYDVFTGRSFSPGNPLTPNSSTDEQTAGPRQFQYPVAANVRLSPRSEYPALTPFDQLRSLSTLYDVAAICINARIEEMQGIGWTIVAKDKKSQKNIQADCDALMKFFSCPDGVQTFNEWLGMLLRDYFEIDALCIYKHPANDGSLALLEPVDGATIKPIIDDRGRTVAYQQVLYGYPQSSYTRPSLEEFDKDNLPIYSPHQLLYKPRWTQTYSPYGRPATETIIMRVNTALRKQAYDLRWFTDGAMPDAIIGLKGQSEYQTQEQFKAFEYYWNELLSGDDAARHRAKFVQGEFQFEQLKPFSYTTVLDEFMLKVTCAAFGVPPSEIGFTEKVNKSSAQSQENVNERRGLRPLCSWLKGIFDGIISQDFGYDNLEWQWEFGEVEDSLDRAQMDLIYINGGVLTPGEVRTMRFGDIDAYSASANNATSQEQQQMNPNIDTAPDRQNAASDGTDAPTPTQAVAPKQALPFGAADADGDGGGDGGDAS